MRFEHGACFAADVLDARPLGDEWAILTRDGRLGDRRLNFSGLEGTLDLHVCQSRRFAAVVERHGRFGRAFDLTNGAVAMALDRGEYYPETSVFPATFIERAGRPLLVHGTDWNRLDVSDPATGECLTERAPTAYRQGERRPPHYLDYFHAGLLPSPDGRWIAEDGWIWHPLGQLRLWSIDDWLGGNLWESEDGLSVRALTEREYFWDTPMVWLDATRLAFWGEGDDAEEMRAVVRIYDADRAEETGRVAGPAVDPARPWPPGSARAGWIAFDRRLFAVSPTSGTGVWTLEGERVHFEEGFAPRRYHPARKEFLSWGDGEAFVSRLVP